MTSPLPSSSPQPQPVSQPAQVAAAQPQPQPSQPAIIRLSNNQSVQVQDLTLHGQELVAGGQIKGTLTTQQLQDIVNAILGQKNISDMALQDLSQGKAFKVTVDPNQQEMVVHRQDVNGQFASTKMKAEETIKNINTVYSRIMGGTAAAATTPAITVTFSANPKAKSAAPTTTTSSAATSTPIPPLPTTQQSSSTAAAAATTTQQSIPSTGIPTTAPPIDTKSANSVLTQQPSQPFGSSTVEPAPTPPSTTGAASAAVTQPKSGEIDDSNTDEDFVRVLTDEEVAEKEGEGDKTSVTKPLTHRPSMSRMDSIDSRIGDDSGGGSVVAAGDNDKDITAAGTAKKAHVAVKGEKPSIWNRFVAALGYRTPGKGVKSGGLFILGDQGELEKASTATRVKQLFLGAAKWAAAVVLAPFYATAQGVMLGVGAVCLAILICMSPMLMFREGAAIWAATALAMAAVVFSPTLVYGSLVVSGWLDFNLFSGGKATFKPDWDYFKTPPKPRSSFSEMTPSVYSLPT